MQRYLLIITINSAIEWQIKFSLEDNLYLFILSFLHFWVTNALNILWKIYTNALRMITFKMWNLWLIYFTIFYFPSSHTVIPRLTSQNFKHFDSFYMCNDFVEKFAKYRRYWNMQMHNMKVLVPTVEINIDRKTKFKI